MKLVHKGGFAMAVLILACGILFICSGRISKRGEMLASGKKAVVVGVMVVLMGCVGVIASFKK